MVKQIRKELKLACAKCASLAPPQEVPTTTLPPEEKPQEDGIGPNSVYHNQPTLDVEKLHQAILAFRPVSKASNWWWGRDTDNLFDNSG